mmetsp:Transcript_5353/g.6037  ORF Transcript_5353/g.6037 Transcript_5353/m.6037 type:complete len:81 (+) Transcript_5353:2-244(+)
MEPHRCRHRVPRQLETKHFGGSLKFGDYHEKQAVTASNDAKATERSTFNFGGINVNQAVMADRMTRISNTWKNNKKWNYT